MSTKTNPNTTHDDLTNTDTSYHDREMDVDLTPEEKETEAEKTMKLIEKKREIESEKKEAYKAYGDQITSLDEQIAEHSKHYLRGKKKAVVKVRKEIRWNDKEVVEFNDDTGEEINRRPLNEGERQMPVPGSEAEEATEDDEQDDVLAEDEGEPVGVGAESEEG